MQENQNLHEGELVTRLFVSLFCISISLLLAGCSWIEQNIPFVSDSNRIESSQPLSASDSVVIPETSGSIAVSRTAPEVEELSPQKMLAFLPSYAGAIGKWLKVDRNSGSVSLMEADKELLNFQVEGADRLTAGVYEIAHKQKDALWYAPDSYFSRRNLPLPPGGDKERYLRGALGSFALFLDAETPIHSGPIWTEDLGGLKASEEGLSSAYYQLEVGALVEVQ